MHDINEKDCPKLDFLLNTWDERKLLPKELVFNMKAHLGNRSIPVNKLKFIIFSSILIFTYFLLLLFMQQLAARPIASNQPSHGGRGNPYPYSMKPAGIPPPKETNIPTQAIYADLVKSEMVNFLNQLYRDLNITDPPTLHELSNANPDLFEKIRLQAEENANALLSMRQNQSVGTPLMRGDHAISSGVHVSQYPSPHVNKPQSAYPYQPPLDDSSRSTTKLYDEQQQLGIQMKVQRQIQNIEQQMQTIPKIQKPPQSFGDDGFIKKRRMDYAGPGGAGGPAPDISSGAWKKQVTPQQYQHYQQQQPQPQQQYSSRYLGRDGPPMPGYSSRGRAHDSGVPYDRERDRDRDRDRDVFRERDRDRGNPVVKSVAPATQDKGEQS